MRSTYKILENNLPHFITSTIINWINIFKSSEYFSIILDNFRFYQKKYEMDVIAFVIMPDHFHAICNCLDLQKAIQYIKSYSAKKILEQLNYDSEKDILKMLSSGKSKYKTRSNYQVWQEGFHPKLIRTSKMLEQKIEYIHYNPVRRGLVEKPEDWEYSSAGFYIKNKNSGLKITPFY